MAVRVIHRWRRVVALMALMIGLPVVMGCPVCLVVAVMVRRGRVAVMVRRGWVAVMVRRGWVPPPALPLVVVAAAAAAAAAAAPAAVPWMRSGVLMGRVVVLLLVALVAPLLGRRRAFHGSFALPFL